MAGICAVPVSKGGRSAGIQRRPHNLSLWTQCFLRLRLHCREKLHTSSCHAVSLQSCPTLCNPMDSSLPGSSVHGISQARILEWVAGPSSRGPSQGLNPCLLRFPNYRWILYCWATREAHTSFYYQTNRCRRTNSSSIRFKRNRST